MVATDQPPVGEPAWEGSNGVEHGGRNCESLRADLGDRGGLPQLAATQGAEGPEGCLRGTVGVDEAPVAGPHSHACGRRDGEGCVGSRSQQVVQEGITELTNVNPWTRTVDHPPCLDAGAVVQHDRQSTLGERLRAAHTSAADGEPSGGAQFPHLQSAARRHPVPEHVPGRGVLGEELQTLVLAEALPERGDLEAQTVHARPPVAGGPDHRAQVVADVRAKVVQRVTPVGDVRDRGQADPLGVRGGEPPVPRHGMQHSVWTVACVAQRQSHIHHRQTGADHQHVGGPAAARRTVSSAPGAHGSGTKKAERRSDSGAQSWPVAGSPVAVTTASA